MHVCTQLRSLSSCFLSEWFSTRLFVSWCVFACALVSPFDWASQLLTNRQAHQMSSSKTLSFTNKTLQVPNLAHWSDNFPVDFCLEIQFPFLFFNLARAPSRRFQGLDLWHFFLMSENVTCVCRRRHAHELLWTHLWHLSYSRRIRIISFSVAGELNKDFWHRRSTSHLIFFPPPVSIWSPFRAAVKRTRGRISRHYQKQSNSGKKKPFRSTIQQLNSTSVAQSSALLSVLRVLLFQMKMNGLIFSVHTPTLRLPHWFLNATQSRIFSSIPHSAT